MGQIQIEVNGVLVNLRSKEELIELIDDLNADGVRALKASGSYRKKKVETGTLSFFGSIAHYLKGGAE